jgi:3-deoxy-D-manno-octulosonic-acid transferase
MQSGEDADRITRSAPSSDESSSRATSIRRAAAGFSSPTPSRLTAAAAGRGDPRRGSTGDGGSDRPGRLEGLVPCPLLVIAPRRPERFNDSRPPRRIPRSQPPPPLAVRPSSPSVPNRQSSIVNRQSDVYLLDSIGELAALYRHAFLAFIGGSLVTTEANPIEAWAEGVAVVVGPHTQNIREIAASGAPRHPRARRRRAELAR